MPLPVISQVWTPQADTGQFWLTFVELKVAGRFVLVAHLSTGYVAEATF